MRSISQLINSNNKKIIVIINIILAFSILIAFLGFFRDYNNNIEYGGVDLRSNVIGARLLLRGVDPFHYVWKKGDSDLFLHPTANPNLPHVTVTPTVLVLYTPIANLPYGIQQKIWFYLQWIFLLLSIFFFTRYLNSEMKVKIIWILGLLFISGAIFWRLHSERGKVIVLYIFFIALAYWISQMKFRYSNILSGFFIGFTVILRPTYALMMIPVLIYKKWKLFTGAVIGLLVGFFMPVIFTNYSIWIKYLSAMQLNEKIHLGLIPIGDFGYIVKTIEGMNNLHRYAAIPTYDSSLQGVFQGLGIILTSKILWISLVILIIIVSFLLYKFRLKNIKMSLLFLIGVVMVLVSEFFLPAVKWSYYDIIWLLPLPLIVINYEPVSKFFNLSVILLLTGFLCSVFSFSIISKNIFAGECLISIYAVCSAVILLVSNKVNEKKLLS
ncbi:MAG: glycosyltransferase 87 family protein [Cyanobacteria bacterium]|nr:glycosyltransferase 87 family protein [Cyanobacteriota bacterium]